MTLIEHILGNWDKTVRLQREGDDRLVGLPYEYYVPSVTGMFQEMYYWDTYFTSRGLYLSGREALVKSAAEDMFYLVEKFGYMPNGNNLGLLGRSQPPVLSEMVKDLYGIYQDRLWLKMAYDVLKKEYGFWMNRRLTPTGLNQYGFNMDECRDIKPFAEMIRERNRGLDLSGRSDEDVVANFMCDAESGWDFNPRCEYYQTECVYVDLNSLLYGMERNMAFFAGELDNGEASVWQKRAEQRKEKMQTLLFDGEVYKEYNFVKNTYSPVMSSAAFFPLWMGVATEEQAEATVRNLPRIERAFGVACCEQIERPVKHQWDYPNGWAPQHYAVVHGLDRYGYREEAERIARKYVRTMEALYEQTGALWEKYNVEEGSNNVNDEYKMPQMLGWTAGIYLDFKRYLKEW